MTPPNLSLRNFLLTVATVGTLPAAFAQSTWTGAGSDGNWTTGGNWNGGVAPVSASTTDVRMEGTTRLSSVVDAPYSLRTLYFNAGSGPFVLSGSALSISATTGQPDGIRNSSTSLQTFNNAVNLSGVSVSANAGDMTFNGNVALGGNGVRFAGGTGKTLTFNGVISGAVTGDAFAINTSGTVIFANAANTYTSETKIWNGTVVAKNNALATGPGAFGNTTSEIKMGIGSGVLNPTLLIGGNYTIGRSIRIENTNSSSVITIGGNTADTSTFSGTITNGLNSSAANSLRVTAAAGGRVNITGNIRRATGATGTADSVVKTGAGIVALEGASNNHSGVTTVSSGTLLINGGLASGGGDVSVASGAVLGGRGTIERNVVVNAGGELSPGDMSGATSMAGTLTVDGNVTLNGGSNFRASLGGTTEGVQYDQLRIQGSGVLSLSGTNNLVLTLDYVPLIGSQFTLVDIAGTSPLSVLGVFEQLNGTTMDLSQGAYLSLGGTQFQISYTAENNVFAGAGNNIMLQVVPEPSAVTMLVGGLLGLLMLARASQKRSAN